MRGGRALRTCALATALAAPAAAHDGPPYPILVDEEIGGRVLSVWADPDVGVGTFYLYLDSAPGLDATEVELVVQPVDDRLPEARHASTPAPERRSYQRFVEVPFDRRGEWDVRFLVRGPSGSGERALVVDVTPPGLGRIDLLWYLAPFLVVGFLWAKVVLKRRELRREMEAEAAAEEAAEDGARERVQTARAGGIPPPPGAG